jgi:hypothetical protein
VPRQVIGRPARSVASWAVPWERQQARSEGFLEFNRLPLQMRASPPVLAAQTRDKPIPREKSKGADSLERGTSPFRSRWFRLRTFAAQNLRFKSGVFLAAARTAIDTCRLGAAWLDPISRGRQIGHMCRLQMRHMCHLTSDRARRKRYPLKITFHDAASAKVGLILISSSLHRGVNGGDEFIGRHHSEGLRAPVR